MSHGQFCKRFGETEGSPKRFQIKGCPKTVIPAGASAESGDLSEFAAQDPRSAAPSGMRFLFEKVL